jgi:signal transduction histidine kinase
MKAITTLFSFLLLSFLVTAQTKQVDSLYELAQSASGAKKIDLYTKLAAITRNTQPDTAIFFARKANELAEEGNSDRSKLQAYLTMGSILHVRGSYDLSGKYYKQALELASKQKNDSLRAVALNGVGAMLWQTGKHAESLENHFKSLRLRERINDTKGIIIVKTSIGMVYQSQEKLPLAEKYVSEALELLRSYDDAALKISTMHTLANIYGMQGKIKEAFALDEEGIVIAERTNNELAKSLFYDNMGNCYLYGTPPDYTKAIEFFTKTLAIDSAFDNKKQMSDSYVNLGSVFFEQKKHNEAIPYLLRCVELANESGYVQGKLKALQMLSTAYRQSGQTDAAYATLKDAMRVKDSLVNTSSEHRIAEMQTLYETEKKQQQINLQELQLSKKNYILAGTILVAVLLGLLGVSGWLRYRLKQKSRLQNEIMNQQELSAKAVIEAEEDERQRIARDLHDGVGQMMSATKMNLSAFESDVKFETKEQQISFEKIIGLVDDSCKEIRNVSHNMMPNALLKNNLATAIRDFIDKMDSKALEVHLDTEGMDERLDSNVETVLYRIIQECVNNVLKHANATTLDISVIKEKDGISVTIEDNGKGFDLNNKEKSDGIGLKNIMTRVEYLKGTVDFDSSPGRGTVIALHVPLQITAS